MFLLKKNTSIFFCFLNLKEIPLRLIKQISIAIIMFTYQLGCFPGEIRNECGDFPGGLVVENPPSNARIPSLDGKLKIPHDSEELSPSATPREAHKAMKTQHSQKKLFKIKKKKKRERVAILALPYACLGAQLDRPKWDLQGKRL